MNFITVVQGIQTPSFSATAMKSLNSSQGTFLGMFDTIEFEVKLRTITKGDRLYFYTDGITEAKGPNGDLFGNHRLKSLVHKLKQEPIGTVLHQVFDEVDLYTQYQKATDDRSVVILEFS